MVPTTTLLCASLPMPATMHIPGFSTNRILMPSRRKPGLVVARHVLVADDDWRAKQYYEQHYKVAHMPEDPHKVGRVGFDPLYEPLPILLCTMQGGEDVKWFVHPDMFKAFPAASQARAARKKQRDIQRVRL